MSGDIYLLQEGGGLVGFTPSVDSRPAQAHNRGGAVKLLGSPRIQHEARKALPALWWRSPDGTPQRLVTIPFAIELPRAA